MLSLSIYKRLHDVILLPLSHKTQQVKTVTWAKQDAQAKWDIQAKQDFRRDAC